MCLLAQLRCRWRLADSCRSGEHVTSVTVAAVRTASVTNTARHDPQLDSGGRVLTTGPK